MNYRFCRKTPLVVLATLVLLSAFADAFGQEAPYDPGQGVDDLARQTFPGLIPEGAPADPGRLADQLARRMDRKTRQIGQQTHEGLPPSAYGEPVDGPKKQTSEGLPPSAYGEPVDGPKIASAAGAGKVIGRIDCRTARYCLFKDLELVGTIDDAMTKQLMGLFEDFSRRVDPQIQPDGFVHTEIKLNSVGGSVSAAMAIGRLLRMNRMRAVVDPSSVCLSACVLVYAGAVVRFGHFNAGRVGIHQPYLDVPVQTKVNSQTVKAAYDGMLRDMKAYLREMNVSEQLADEMLKVPSTSVRYLSNEEQDQFGLVIHDPVEIEISDVEQAQELGVTRAELMRRKVLSMQQCYARDMRSRNSDCYTAVMKTGRVPN